MEDFQAILVITLLTWAAVSVSGATPELSTTTGDTVTIPCHFGEGTIRNIFWYYDDGTGPQKISFFADGALNIEAAYANRASLQNDYSTLVLKNISVADEGTYRCDVDRQEKMAVINIYTKLNVFSLRPDTLPVISLCTWADKFSSCSIHANQSFTLTCTLPNVYPVEDTELIWYQDRKRFPSIPEVTQNDDGTIDISRQIQVSETGNFTCNAKYLSANGRDNTAVSVEARIIPPEDEPITPGKKMTSGHIVGMTIGIVLVVGTSLAIIVCFIVRSKARDITNSVAENDQVTSAESDACIGLSTQNGYNNEKVKTSPTEEPDFDIDFLALAKKIPVIQINQLGKDLGFDAGEVQRYVATNSRYPHVTCDGTLAMLRDWHKKQTKAKKALVDAGLGRLPFEFSRGEGSVTTEVLELLEISPETGPDNRYGPQQETAIGPEPGASAVSSTSRREVTDKEINNLSKILPDGKYGELFVTLGFNYDFISTKKKKSTDSTAASEELLQEWKNKGRFMKELDAALIEAELGGLVPEYKK